MKTSDLMLLGIVGIGAYFLMTKSTKAGEISPTDYPIESTLRATTETMPYKTTVSTVTTPQALKSTATPTLLKPITAPIQITEGGSSYIPPYRIVEVGTTGEKAITSKPGVYTTLSSGFYSKMKSLGIA